MGGQVKWKSVKDVAIMLDVSVDTIRRRVKDGTIPCYKIGRVYRFNVSEIQHLTKLKCRIL